jgi:hypothetical protein
MHHSTVLAEPDDRRSARCATPGCGRAAELIVTAGWPTGIRDISRRCRPCAGRIALARLDHGCGVQVMSLDAGPEEPGLRALAYGGVQGTAASCWPPPADGSCDSGRRFT